MEAAIEHVSDTALMVAACRAMETERADGLVRDPFADRLAGTRGMEIARSVPFLELMCFVVGVRARFIDELLIETVRREQIEAVVNLGAGLDTRPWRLDLPAGLLWIEADFPEILHYKAGRLGSQNPRCRLEQVPADLASPESRTRLFQRAGSGPALMVTEGLLMYLPQAVVGAFAQEAPRLSGVRHWLLDVASTDSYRHLTGGGGWKNTMERLRPPDHLAGQALLDAVRQGGWEIMTGRLYASDLSLIPPSRLARLAETLSQAGNLEQPRDEVSGVYLFRRAMHEPH